MRENKIENIKKTEQITIGKNYNILDFHNFFLFCIKRAFEVTV